MDPDDVELRVLGCLLEKQRTTPDAYPLTLNALRLACNQATNRDPVVEYDDTTIREALEHLRRRGWTRMASGAGSRAPKYRHLVDEELGLGRADIAVLCVLMLRGPQTPGELNQRTERLHRFEASDTIEATLARLVGRELVVRSERRPGQKEARYAQRLGTMGAGGDDGAADPAHGALTPRTRHPADPADAPPPAPRPGDPADGAPRAPHPAGLAERVARLEDEVATLRARLAALETDVIQMD